MIKTMSICYLCGLPLSGEDTNSDHVVPKLLINRKQPRANGFQYGGFLPTHQECNSKFGNSPLAEGKCKQALELLSWFFDTRIRFERKDNDKVKIVALTREELPSFTDEDVKLFELIDARDEPYEKWTSESFLLAHKPQVDPFRKAINISLSVLAKSSAASLIKNRIIEHCSRWKILAVPYLTEYPTDFLDKMFGQIKPFDIGVKLWLKSIEDEAYLAAYTSGKIIVFFFFVRQEAGTILHRLLPIFKDAEPLF